MRKLAYCINLRKTVIICCSLMLMGIGATAQDIEPRRWTSMPLGVKVIGVGYAHTTGKIFFDPALQVKDATFNSNSFVIQYLQPIKIGNKQARLDVLIPFSIAHWEGNLGGVRTSVNRNGFADPRVRFSINFIGINAMGPKAMQEFILAHPKRTSFGASLAVTLPLGQYFDEKVLNLGQNRFVFRPQVGMVHHWGKWAYELTGSVFLYTKNNRFSNGGNREQNATFAVQTHLVRRFKYKMWTSLSAGYGLGGQSIVNSQAKDDERGDLLGAVSFGIVLNKRQSLKLSYLRTQTIKDVGGDLNSFVLGWSVLF